jgi:hypothetical protein
VEAVIQRLRDQQISVQAALEELTQTVEETVEAEEEQAESDMETVEFALYWVLRGQGFDAPQATAREVYRVLAEHPGWRYNPRQERAARLQLYKVLQPHVTAEQKAQALKQTVDALLRMGQVVEK